MKPLQFNNLEVRLAKTSNDVDAAQALRYKIFYEDMGAIPTTRCRALKRDIDSYDDVCDHLLVIDLEKGTNHKPCVVGTYRLLLGNIAKATTGFYSETEFDVNNFMYTPEEVLELGRSCIDSDYRRRGAMQLLWRGISEYIDNYDVKLMFGCGSIHGTDVNEASRVLSYLHHFHLAPKSMRPVALSDKYISMNLMKKNALDIKQVQRELPPLLKGYLRVGGYVGKGAVIDHRFNTIDVSIVVETEHLAGKYRTHFQRDTVKSSSPAQIVAAE